jgi:phenylalanyl-tRNA synthetase beta chain
MADMVGAMAGGQIASSVLDNKTDLVNPMSSVQVTSEFINSRLGSTLTDGDIIKLLSNVEFSVSIEDGILDITPPFWRTDILISEDVVEEVGRLYGYDNLPLALPVRQLAPVDLDRDLSLKKDVRSILSRLGANELLNYSFVHKNLLNKANQDENLAFKITNAISPDLQFYRLSLTPSLLEKIHPNIKLGFNEFALFEQGVVHTKDQLDNNSLPIESSRVSFVCAKASIQNNLNEGSPYFLAKKYLSNLLDPTIEYRDLQSVDFESNADKQSAAPYEPKRSAILYSNGKIVGVVGEFKQDVKRAFKLPEYCAGFEISTSAINVKSSNYQPLSRFPSTEQDITLSVSADVTYRDLHNCLVDAFMAEEGLTVGVFPQSIYSKNDKLKNVSFRIKVTPLEKTLRTEYVNGLLDKASKKAHDKLGAIRI